MHRQYHEGPSDDFILVGFKQILCICVVFTVISLIRGAAITISYSGIPQSYSHHINRLTRLSLMMYNDDDFLVVLEFADTYAIIMIGIS